MSELITDPENWLLHTLYKANKTDVETFRIYQCLTRYITDNRDFIGVVEEVVPTVLRYKPQNDVADDCFFGVTFFPGLIRARKHKRGAPGVRYYEQAGKNAYSNIGYAMISKNWSFWVSYINNHVKMNK